MIPSAAFAPGAQSRTVCHTLSHSVTGVGTSGSDPRTMTQTQPPELGGPVGWPLGGPFMATAEGKEARSEGHVNTVFRVGGGHVPGKLFSQRQPARGVQHPPSCPASCLSVSLVKVQKFPVIVLGSKDSYWKAPKCRPITNPFLGGAGEGGRGKPLFHQQRWLPVGSTSPWHHETS